MYSSGQNFFWTDAVSNGPTYSIFPPLQYILLPGLLLFFCVPSFAFFDCRCTPSPSPSASLYWTPTLTETWTFRSETTNLKKYFTQATISVSIICYSSVSIIFYFDCGLSSILLIQFTWFGFEIWGYLGSYNTQLYSM